MKKLQFIFAASLLLSVLACNNKPATPENVIPIDTTAVDTTTAADATAVVEEEELSIDDQQAEDLINSIYKKYVFGDNVFSGSAAKKYCTASLRSRLKKEYDFDDGGYAIWLFRTDLQDGPSDHSAVNSITCNEPNAYTVTFSDMGNSGSHVLYFAQEDGEWKIDKIK